MYTVGIDLGGTSVKMGVIGRDVEPVWRGQIPFVAGDPEAMLGQIAQKVGEAMERYPVSRVGIACAGSVELETGRVWGSNIAFSGVPVKEILQDALKVPVWVDNDAQAALQAEWTSGACKGANHAVFLCYGTGIGGALICNGQPYRGRANGGAELGHIITHAFGEPCTCGQKGCYEAYASATALQKRAGKDPRAVFELAKAGDRAMLALVEEYCREVSIGIVSLLAVFEPEVVVLGGGISQAGRYFLDKVHRAIEDSGTWCFSEDVLVTLARHKNDAGIVGAASLAEYYLDEVES